MKKILIGIVSIVLLVIVGVRIWYVNKDVDIAPVYTYKMGEEVAIEEDFFLDDYEDMNGYTVTVNNAEIMSYEEFLAKYQYEESEDSPLFEDGDMLFPEMVYELHLTVKNTNPTEDIYDDSGIAFLNYHLTGTDFLLQISRQLYEVAQPNLEVNMMMSFRLRPETEMDFYLPFYFQPSAKSMPIQVEDIMNDDLYLVVSKYPNAKRILIK
ncbi:DUF5028 domain-containing protein [Bacillus niameyensis]|uniref:DUF5028 domain-containing protein n=1 Tax=Bacillus niameyensis TaxID=1522308 RepID=UPI000782ED69|nr:DUF5028 domain-containing protein [Bacillus niameyensis]